MSEKRVKTSQLVRQADTCSLSAAAASSAGRGADPDSHVMVSGDADIFLLSLIQSLSRRVTVVAEFKPYRGGGNRRGVCLPQYHNATAAWC